MGTTTGKSDVYRKRLFCICVDADLGLPSVETGNLPNRRSAAITGW
jgi:hypothetical protein